MQEWPEDERQGRERVRAQLGVGAEMASEKKQEERRSWNANRKKQSTH